MGLELPGVTRIDTPAEARAHSRRWNRMARELDTPEAPEPVQEKVRELRQRAAAADAWARKEEDALLRAQHAHDQELDNVVPLHPGENEEQRHARTPGHVQRAARRAGNAAYAKARPAAMRIAHQGKQHFFQGLEQPFGPTGDAGALVMEGLGLTVAVILLADLLKAPGVIGDVGSRATAAIKRWTSLSDPFTGATVNAAGQLVKAGGVTTPATAHPAATATTSS